MDLTAFFVVYTVGTIFGIWFGFKSGVKKGADVTLDMLMVGKFLLYKRHQNGDIEFLKPHEVENYQQNQ